MNAFRIFPFIGAVIAIAGVVLSIIGVSTTYWFSRAFNIHSGLWQKCIITGCVRTEGGRAAAMALTVNYSFFLKIVDSYPLIVYPTHNFSTFIRINKIIL